MSLTLREVDGRKWTCLILQTGAQNKSSSSDSDK